MPDASQLVWLTSWNPDGLALLASEMSEAEQRGDPFKLDLSDEALAGTARASAVRLHIPGVLAVANLLIGRFRELALSVRLPASRGLNLQLARGGVFFALSNRVGVHWPEGAPSAWESVSGRWVQPFHPSDADMYREALVTARDLDRDDWMVRAAFQRYLLSVMHPHLRPATSLREDLQGIARRWLSTRLLVTQGSELVATLLDCAEIFYEIIVNVPDHAGIAMSPTGSSLGQLYATLGGGHDSHNRLHFSVMDNGVGMPRRVNERFTDRHRDAAGALADSVTGRLPRRAGGRGVGLHRVHEIASHYEAGLRSAGGASSIRIIATGDAAGDAVELDWKTDAAAPTTNILRGIPIQGTVVWVCLGLERRTAVHNWSDQLELTFAEPVSS